MYSILSTRSKVSRSSLALVAAVGIAASGLAIAAPAQAATSGIGTGRAVVHVDAPTATVTKQADGTYLLAMPQGTTGQWMGERKNSSGKTIVRVGKLTGEKLASNWSNLKYTSAGVAGTLVWDAQSVNHQAAGVTVSKPKSTDTGVTFTLTSKTDLPATMSDVSINLERAPGKKTVRSSSPQAINITSDLWWSAQNNNSSAAVRLYNSTNNNTCWSKNIGGDPHWASVGSNRCDNIAYTDGNSPGTSAASGGNTIWDCNRGDENVLCSAQMSLALTPDGQSQYKYNSTINF